MTQRSGSGSYDEPCGGRDTFIIFLLCGFDEVSSSSVAEDSPSLIVESVKLGSLGEQGSDAAVSRCYSDSFRFWRFSAERLKLVSSVDIDIFRGPR